MPNASHTDFEASVAPHRAELHAYCYRMLGSLQDAEDALQEALIGAYKGFAGLQERSALRAWLYRIASHACMQIAAKRPKRLLASDRVPATHGVELEPMSEEPVWLEPYPEMADATFEMRESVELAFVAALQHLPATQRATLILREVLGFEASEVAEQLETSVASVNSGLQRARETVARRVPPKSQQATLRELGDAATRELVTSFVEAWARHDVDRCFTCSRTTPSSRCLRFRTGSTATKPSAASFANASSSTSGAWHRCARTASSRSLVTKARRFAWARSTSSRCKTARYRHTGFLDPRVHARFRMPER